MEAETLPMVTIGIPTYNGGAHILTSLSAVWEQDYPNLEIVISDNCSTDNTKETIEEICKVHPEIKYFRQDPNIGMLPNFMFLLKKASGKYFMWVSDDDRLEAGVLLKYVTFLETNREYSLVSGKIRYWLNNKPDIIEEGFTFESNSRKSRVINFYAKVIYGGLIHGLMRKELTKKVSLHSVIGNDYHFIANLAYLGKIKNFDFIGYNKSFGGLSKNFKGYAKAIGDSKFAGAFPQLKIAVDAYAEVMYRSPVFAHLNLISKFSLACTSFCARHFCYFGRIVIWSRIQKYIIDPIVKLVK